MILKHNNDYRRQMKEHLVVHCKFNYMKAIRRVTTTLATKSIEILVDLEDAWQSPALEGATSSSFH